MEIYGMPCSKQRLRFLLQDGQLVKQFFEKAIAFCRCLRSWKPGGVSFANEAAIMWQKSYVPNGIILACGGRSINSSAG